MTFLFFNSFYFLSSFWVIKSNKKTWGRFGKSYQCHSKIEENFWSWKAWTRKWVITKKAFVTRRWIQASKSGSFARTFKGKVIIKLFSGTFIIMVFNKSWSLQTNTWKIGLKIVNAWMPTKIQIQTLSMQIMPMWNKVESNGFFNMNWWNNFENTFSYRESKATLRSCPPKNERFVIEGGKRISSN